MLGPLLRRHLAHDPSRGFRLLADQAYSHNSTRILLRQLRIKHTIPERSDQIAYRKAKGVNGGRPPAFAPSCTATATPSSAASTGSRTGVGSLPGMTSTR
jgi:hypothetical protein